MQARYAARTIEDNRSEIMRTGRLAANDKITSDEPDEIADKDHDSVLDCVMSSIGKWFLQIVSLFKRSPAHGDPDWKPRWASEAPFTVGFVRSVVFKTVRLHRGIEIRQVDDLLSRLANTLSIIVGTSFAEGKQLNSIDFEMEVFGLKRTWWRKGYDEGEVLDFMAGAVSTLRTMESNGVIIEAEKTIRGALESGSGDDAIDGKTAMEALIAWEQLSSTRIAELEAELDSLKMRLTGRLH